MKNTMVSARIKYLTLAWALSFGANAHAGGVAAAVAIPGANLPEQIVQELTLADSLVQQATQVQQQLNMLQNQARNLSSLPSQMWPEVSGQLTQLIQISRQSRALAYSGGDMIASVQRTYGNAGQTLTNAAQSYKNWNDNSNQQLASTLQSYGMQADNFATEQDALSAVQAASQSATGRMQALQAGNAIAGMQVNQTQLLRSAVMDGNAAILTATSTQGNVQQQEKNIQNDWMKIPPKRGVW